MLKRFYTHNFRCLENFEFAPGGPSALLIGPNGSGKSTIMRALEVLQKVARGTSRVGDLVKPTDFARGENQAPMRFELEVELDGRAYAYVLVLEFPKGFRELRVLEERLSCDGTPRYTRSLAAVTVSTAGRRGAFDLDWHVVALPIVQGFDDSDPVTVFRQWLRRMMILAPQPSEIRGTSTRATLEPELSVNNLGDWFTGLVAAEPSAYGLFTSFLTEVFPDFKAVQNPSIGEEAREMRVQFQNADGRSLTLPLAALSDGEKCFVVAATALAAASVYGPLLCVWDEADAHLSLQEVSQFTQRLRRAAGPQLQLLMSSHNAHAIRMFSEDTTWVVFRTSHLEPTRLKRLQDFEGRSGDLIADLARGDLP